MSVRLGSNIIAGRSPQPSLFDFKWADHIISDPQWVRADTNSWQYKVAYDAAYNHLEADIEGKEAQSETIEGIIITYYLANDGHKVCLPDQGEYLDALYNTTGVAWYYIVDTINKRFKVPRTKWGFTGVRSQTSVGNYIAAGLPNITGHLLFDYGSYSTGPYNVTGAFKNNVNKSGRPNTYDSNTASGDVSFDASLSNPIYGNSLTVQPQATQMYLYFFVGSFTQDALINAAAFSVESIAEVLDEQTTTIAETWDTASETIAASMTEIQEDMEQLDTMINAQYHPNIFESKWSDHILNDIQWLRGDTFSWQSGDVYETAYQHLVDDIQDKTLQTETVSGITISYYLADDEHKICPDTQVDNLIALYNKTGIAWYYVLDQENTRFKLPRKHSTQLIESVKNSDGSWYRLYADGWVEQGGEQTVTSVADGSGTAGNNNVNLLVAMSDTHYWVMLNVSGGSSGWQYYNGLYVNGKTTSNMTVKVVSGASSTTRMYWEVKGMSNIDISAFQANEKYLYFYVGKFLQSAVVNTAGLNAELFNGKADIDAVVAKGHEVIEFQAPTSTNNYTWYRKYADGWVEQGGYVQQPTNTGQAVTLPITMLDAYYQVMVSASCGAARGGGTSSVVNRRQGGGWAYSSSVVYVISMANESASTTPVYWQVSGMAA